MRHPSRPIAQALVLFLALGVASQGKSASRFERSGDSGTGPSANAAASILPNAGDCIKFISVYVPARGGDYVVGVSFTYRDMNRDGRYTPGVDKLDVCVNCSDACGWGP
jgi:hypothetical protein